MGGVKTAGTKQVIVGSGNVKSSATKQVIMGNTATKQVMGNTKTKQVVISSGAVSSGTKQVMTGGTKQVMGGSVVGIETGKPGIKG